MKITNSIDYFVEKPSLLQLSQKNLKETIVRVLVELSLRRASHSVLHDEHCCTKSFHTTLRYYVVGDVYFKDVSAIQKNKSTGNYP